MKSSMKLAVIVALTATVVFGGCSEDDSGSNGVGSGKGGTTGKGGSAGSGGNTVSGGTSGGTSKGGSSGSSGSGGNAGTQAGTGGGGNAGTPAGGGAGGEVVGGAGGTPAACELDGSAGVGGDFGMGGFGGTGEVTTTVVLLDNVVVKDATNNTVIEWLFENADDIADTTTHTPDKWIRTPWNPPANDPGAQNTFFECGSDDLYSGSMRNHIMFTAATQIYEVRVPFAAADYGGYNVTATAKMVSGGCEAGAVLAELYAVSEVGGNPIVNGPVTDLVPNVWRPLTMLITDNADFAMTGSIGLRVHTQACNL